MVMARRAPPVHALLYRKTGAEGEILDPGDRMIGGESDRNPRLLQDPRRFKIRKAHLVLGAGRKGGTDDRGKAAFGDLLPG